jgi:hypothetical protein
VGFTWTCDEAKQSKAKPNTYLQVASPFSTLLRRTFQVFRSIKFSKLHEQSRQAEIERIEQKLLAARSSRSRGSNLKFRQAARAALFLAQPASDGGSSGPPSPSHQPEVTVGQCRDLAGAGVASEGVDSF